MRAQQWGLLAVGVLAATTASIVGLAPPAAAASNLDRSYGSQGLAIIPSASTIDSNVEIATDGSAVMVASPVGLAKISPTGSAISSFSTNSGGQRVAAIQALDIDAQGRTVTAEIPDYGSQSLVLRRFLTDGKPDTDFGTNGVVTYATGQQQLVSPRDVEIDAQGRILVAGTIPGSTSGDRCVVTRFLSSGSVDTSFGTNGTSLAVPDLTYCSKLLPRSDGGLIVVVAATIVRLDASGHIAAYGAGTSFQAPYFITGAALRSDGSVAFATVADPTVSLLTPAGAYDTSFSGDGRDQVSFGSLLPQIPGNEPNDILIGRVGFLSNGTLVGWGANGDGLGVAHWKDGALDTTYGSGGRIVVFHSELPGGSMLGGGALANDVLYPAVAGDGPEGLARISGSTVTPLAITGSPLSGPHGTTVSFSGGGCPQSNVYPYLEGTNATFDLNDPHVTSMIDGTFSGTFEMPPEPGSTSRRTDHQYHLMVFCSSINKGATGPVFTYTSGIAFRPVGPQRLLDTRPGSPVGPATGSPANGKIVHVPVPTDAQLGIPAGGTKTVVLSVTAVQAAAPGWVTAYPCFGNGEPPLASNLNVDSAGQTVANLVAVRPDNDHEVCLYTSSASHLVVDLMGTIPETSDYEPTVDPRRVWDTRDHHSATPTAGSVTKVHVGLVTTPHQALLLNVTATGALAGGWVTVWPCDQARPYTSNLNLDHRGQTVANLVATDIDPNGDVCLFTSGGAHLILDYQGTWSVSLRQPAAPVRLLDTRADGPQVGYSGGRPGADQTVQLQVTGRAGVPTNAAGVALNVTATGGDGAGWVTVWPCGQAKPYTSNLNLLRAGQAVPVAVMAGLGSGGKVCLSPSVGTHLIADLAGWFPTP